MNAVEAAELAEAIIELVAFAYNAASTNPNSYQNSGNPLDEFYEKKDRAVAKFVKAVKRL